MKIAFIGIKGFPSKGGTERVIEAVLKHLVGRHEITVYCDDRYTPAGTHFEGVRLIRVPTLSGKHTRAASLFVLSALHALLFGNYDLIHLNGVDASFVLPLLRLRYRVVTTSHGSPTRNRKEKWSRLAMSIIEKMEYPFVFLSNYATSVSITDAEYYENRYHRKVAYIPNGVEENISYDEAAAREALKNIGVEPGNFLLFCAGRVDPTKGCHLAIEAYNQADLDIPLVLIGDFNQLPSYTGSLKQLASGRNVHFVPLITNKELLFGIVKQCKFFIFPSVIEGMSVMLLEAGSLGAPIVCSDIPENRAAMSDCVCYFKSESVPDLAEKMCWALAHPDQMAALGKSARETVLRRLPWGKIAACYDMLYHACAARQALPDLKLMWEV